MLNVCDTVCNRDVSVCSRDQNIVGRSYFFNFECCIIATQIHWKMLIVVNHMPFLFWIYKCSMFVTLYVTAMYQCVYGNLIPIMLRIVYLAGPPYGIIYVYWYTDHQPVIRTQSFYFQCFKKEKCCSVSTQAQWPSSSPSVTSFPAGRGKRSYLLPRENFKLPYLPNQAH